MSGTDDFERFVNRIEPQLRRAFAGHFRSTDVADAVSEALAYAWQHRLRVMSMTNPVGYLYRVGQSKQRQRKQGFLQWHADNEHPDFEPGLVHALALLAPRQSVAVWLVVGCGLSHSEAGTAMGIRPSTVATHVQRGLDSLRSTLGVTVNG